MRVKGLLIASLALAALMAAFAFYAASQVAPGTQLPVHWNAAGEVNGTLPALQALLFPVVAVLSCTALFSLIPRLEPLQDGLEGSAEVLRTIWIGLLFIMVMIQAAVSAPAFGIKLPVALPLLGVGLFFIVIGVALAYQSLWPSTDRATLSGFILVLLYMKGPLEGLIGQLPVVSRAQVAFRRIAELSVRFSSPEPNLLLADDGRPALDFQRLELRDLAYHYPTDDGARGFGVGPLNLTVNRG